jgi:hypothetical protein
LLLAWLFVSPVGAIDRNHQRRGYGRFLLAEALFRAVPSDATSPVRPRRTPLSSMPRMMLPAGYISATASCRFPISLSGFSDRRLCDDNW